MADSLPILLLAVVAAGYARGVARCWATAGSGRIVHRAQAACAAGAFGALLVALAPPLADAAHDDLAWHMVQHVVLLGVVAPLLAVGAPLTAWLYALPGGMRRRVQPLWRRILRAQSATGWWAWTGTAFVVANVTVAVWHLPAPYDSAVHRASLHALEHLSFVATATWFWWMALGAGRASRRGSGVLAVFVATLPVSALGLLMTLATTSWYAAYGHGAEAVQHQQLAGSIMWGFGGAAAVFGGAALFATWLHAMDRMDAP